MSTRSIRGAAHFITFIVYAWLPFYTFAAPTDSSRFETILLKGDSVYRQKQGYSSFRQSLAYFDSANYLAEQSGNIAMLAQATFARGRVYDAWNKEPKKTIGLFTSAADLFYQAGDERQYYYVRHLVAHAYDKIGDRANVTKVLRELMAVLAVKDSATRRDLPFIPEMALIATEVQAYGLADSILNTLTQRAWIANDPNTYNYLDHYYLTRSRLDLYGHQKHRSPYIDSLTGAYNRLGNLSDRLYYAHQLASLCASAGDSGIAYRFMSAQQQAQEKMSEGSDFEQMQQALIASETAAERRRATYESAISRSRAYGLWALALLLGVITTLSIYLYRRNVRYRAQSASLRDVNAALDSQVDKVELMNKEMQHRIKNNLYTIYSLLHMQQDSTDNEEVIAHLEAARLRVESVASLHDHLLGSDDTVDFGGYIKVLVNKVVACFADRRSVVTHIKAEPVTLPLNTCFALSLIFNEWITNSIKHAAAEGEVLNMDLSIINSDGQVCIDYHDDGKFDLNITPGKGLGTEITGLLVAQIKGQLTTNAHNPYHYNLCIPDKVFRKQ